MKIKVLSFLLLISSQIFAHEDYYEAVELSNLHLKIMVGYKSSPQLQIAKSYASAINDFVCEFAPTEKVFIQFNEDYCFSENNITYLAYGKFKDKLIPKGFPFSYKYNLGFIDSSEGINIIIQQKDFKIKPLLLLIEFVLKNKNSVIQKELIYRGKQSNSDMNWITDSLYNGNLSQTNKKYLNRRIQYIQTPEILKNKGIELYLQNDSIFFIRENKKLLSIATFHMIRTEEIKNNNLLFNTNSIFVFDTNNSFYFLDTNLKSNNKQYDLSFKISCIGDVSIDYQQETTNYKLTKIDRVFADHKPLAWNFFSEKDGVTLNGEIYIEK